MTSSGMCHRCKKNPRKLYSNFCLKCQEENKHEEVSIPDDTLGGMLGNISISGDEQSVVNDDTGPSIDTSSPAPDFGDGGGFGGGGSSGEF